MSKLYFLIPDAARAEHIVMDLRREGVQDEDIGVLGSEATFADSLPDPDITQTSDVEPAIRQGVAVGGATGLLAGLAATIVPGGFAVGGAALLGMTLAGSAFGAWASSLIGVSVPNREVEAFQRAMEAGQLLMIVSATSISRDRVKAIVSGHHPDVVYGGEGDDVRTVA